jgi:exopolysaccharide biosynthesis polyprenyl glycosylphosphotransferase
MNPVRRRLLDLLFNVVDLAVMVTSFVLAAETLVSGSQWNSLLHFFELRLSVSNLLLFIVWMAAWYVIFTAFGLYRTHRLSTARAEIFDVIKATSFATTAILAFASILDIDLVTYRFLVVFWVLSTAITVLARLILRAILERFRVRGRNLRNLLIVGTNARALRFAEAVENKPTLGYQVMGFVDEQWRGVAQFRRTGRELAARLTDFDDYIRQHVVDEVVVALPVSSYYAEFAHVLRSCEEQGILVHMLPDFFDVRRARLKLEVLEDQPVITLRTGAMEGWPLLVKRILDVTVALGLLILLAPFFVIVALVIRLTSPGPVFFVQERVGRNKRPFRFLKFRTMVQGAEGQQGGLEERNEISGPVFKIRNDPRITRIGALLRRTSIDELPQLINVLLGDMSLVGPRPLPVRDYQGFDADWHRRRVSVRPGMTCLWQVAGRTSIPFARWMELDMQYIDNWSLWLDLKLLVRTIPAVVSGKGAA